MLKKPSFDLVTWVDWLCLLKHYVLHNTEVMRDKYAAYTRQLLQIGYL